MNKRLVDISIFVYWQLMQSDVSHIVKGAGDAVPQSIEIGYGCDCE